jgi:hypothetical protein
MHLGPGLVGLPGTVLWIRSIEMGEKLLIGQMPETRSVVCHGIELAGEVAVHWDVSVVSLVNSLESQEKGRSGVGGG